MCTAARVRHPTHRDAQSLPARAAKKGASPANTDVEVSDVFVKVNKRPYLLALDLHAAVKHLECTTSFAEGIVTLRLLKAHSPSPSLPRAQRAQACWPWPCTGCLSLSDRARLHACACAQQPNHFVYQNV